MRCRPVFLAGFAWPVTMTNDGQLLLAGKPSDESCLYGAYTPLQQDPDYGFWKYRFDSIYAAELDRGYHGQSDSQPYVSAQRERRKAGWIEKRWHK